MSFLSDIPQKEHYLYKLTKNHSGKPSRDAELGLHIFGPKVAKCRDDEHVCTHKQCDEHIDRVTGQLSA